MALYDDGDTQGAMLEDNLRYWRDRAEKAEREHEHAVEWYGRRWARLRELVRGTEIEREACCVMANGTANLNEHPIQYVPKTALLVIEAERDQALVRLEVSEERLKERDEALQRLSDVQRENRELRFHEGKCREDLRYWFERTLQLEPVAAAAMRLWRADNAAQEANSAAALLDTRWEYDEAVEGLLAIVSALDANL